MNKVLVPPHDLSAGACWPHSQPEVVPPSRDALRELIAIQPWQFVVQFMRTRVPIHVSRYEAPVKSKSTSNRRPAEAVATKFSTGAPHALPRLYRHRLAHYQLNAHDVQKRVTNGFYSYLRRLTGKDFFLFCVVEDYEKHGSRLAAHAGVFLGGLNRLRIAEKAGSVESAIVAAAEHAGIALRYDGPDSETIFDCQKSPDVAGRKIRYLTKSLEHAEGGSDCWAASESLIRRLSRAQPTLAGIPSASESGL